MRNLALRDSGSEEIQSMAYALDNIWTLESWMRRNWHIVDDPPEAEFILSPALMVRCLFFAGDCDDAATFAASILRALHVPCQLIAIRVGSDTEFTHVFCRVPGIDLDIDPIVPAERLPIPYTEAMIMEV